ncbi:MAG: peptide ABC transporter substrate-binding protein [Chlamydiota bacterium]
MVIPSPTPQVFLENNQDLYTWAFSFSKRFPNWVDSRLIRGLNAILGAGAARSFVDERSFFHLKRLLITQFLLQKKIEQKLNEEDERPLFVRVFSLQSRLCIAIVYSKAETDLKSDAILEMASQKVPALKKVEFSSYQWASQDLPYAFYYLELEKMRGKDLLFAEIKDLENHLKKHLCHYISELSVFWPYNHEEAFKQLLVLAKEIFSAKDYPQVSIHFQKQTAHQLEFLIYLARPKPNLSPETAITSSQFPVSIQLILHLTKEIDTKVPTLIEAFSVLIPIEKCKKGTAINLLHAREFVGKLLENIVGTFRDYNGGLFDTQKKRFEELSRLFAEKIPNFDLFGADLFYALTPVEAQICLDDSLFEKLFEGFAQALGDTTPFLVRPNSEVVIFNSLDLNELVSYLRQAKKLQLQGKILAYANFRILARYYVCMFGIKFSSIEEIGNQSLDFSSAMNRKRSLNLAFQYEEVPSLCPSYLSRELRGRILSKLLFEGLVRLGLENRIEYAGCENIEISEDQCRYLFQLRELYWSNGERVTAVQYERAWKRNILEETNINSFYSMKHARAIRLGEKTVECLGVKTLDEKHLEVQLEQADPNFLRKLSHPLFLPIHEEVVEPNCFNGPYCVLSKDNNNLILEVNPFYWEREKLFFRNITIRFGVSLDHVAKQFENNQLDWVGDPFIRDYSSFSKLDLKEKNVNRPYFLYLNTKYFPLSSPLIRSALSCVIDREFIIKHIYAGCQPLFTMIPKDTPPDIEVDHALLAGQQLFEKAMRSLGLTQKTFPTLVLGYCHTNKDKKLMEYIKERWETAFGIKVLIDGTKWNSLYRQLERGNFQIIGIFKSFMLAYDNWPFLESFSMQGSNYSRWTSLEYSDYLNKAKKSRSEQEKTHYLQLAEQFLLSSLPVIPLFTDNYRYASNAKLKDYIIDEEGIIDFRFSSFTT